MLGNNTEVKSKVAVLEQRTDYQEALIEKVDAAIQVMKDAVDNVSKMLAVHNERLDQHNKTEEVLIEMIKSTRTSLEAEDVDLSDRIDELNVNIEELRKFKWVAVGAGCAAGFVLTTIVSFATASLTSDHFTGRMLTSDSVVQRK
tara:strand:- start:1654 stop:2088 length:435 start_codon:yes stop_codon:yes gene_type:complete